MNLTPEQQQALDHGDAVPIIVDGRECVVLRREVYEQSCDDADAQPDIRMMQPLLAECDPQDWEDISNYDQQ